MIPEENIARRTAWVPLIQHDMFTEFTAVWSADYFVVGGTGRFESIGPGPEPLNAIAINDPFTLADTQWTFRWNVAGFIELD